MEVIKNHCQSIIESKKDYIACFKSIYVPPNHNHGELYKEIKSVLMEKYHVFPETICKSIKEAALISPKHLKFYAELFKLICSENFQRFKIRKPRFCDFNDIVYELRGDIYSMQKQKNHMGICIF